MKHRIIGLIVLVALAALGVQFFLEYQKSNRHHHLQGYRSPPIAPLNAKMTQEENAPSIQSADSLMRQHFNTDVDVVAVVPAWIVQVATLSTPSAAQTLLTQLQALGCDTYVFPMITDNKTTYRVNVGPFTQQSEAMTAIATIQKSLKMTGILKQYNPSTLN